MQLSVPGGASPRQASLFMYPIAMPLFLLDVDTILKADLLLDLLLAAAFNIMRWLRLFDSP